MELPRDAEDPIQVFVNGIAQQREIDYRLVDGEIVFAEPIWKEEELSPWRFAALMLVGRYQRNEVVDIEYTNGGTTKLLSDVDVRPSAPTAGPQPRRRVRK